MFGKTETSLKEAQRHGCSRSGIATIVIVRLLVVSLIGNDPSRSVLCFEEWTKRSKIRQTKGEKEERNYPATGDKNDTMQLQDETWPPSLIETCKGKHRLANRVERGHWTTTDLP